MKTLSLLVALLLPSTALRAADRSDGGLVASALPIGQSVNYFQQKLNATDTKYNTKCWTSFRRIEDIVAGRRLRPEAALKRAELLDGFAHDLWAKAQYMESKKADAISPEIVEDAFRLFFRLAVVKDASGAAALQVPMGGVGTITIPEQDKAIYGKTAETWRAFLSIAQTYADIKKELSPAAADALSEKILLYNLALLKLGARLAEQVGSHEITKEHLVRADNVLRKRGIFYFTNGRPSRKIAERRILLPQSIWYAHSKVSSMDAVNGKIDKEPRREHLSDLAGMKLTSQAQDRLEDAILPEIARGLWLDAQKRTGQRPLVSGEDMWEAIESRYPSKTDENENVTFFPDGPKPLQHLAFRLDAVRDDNLHWNLIERLHAQEVDAESADPAKLYAPLDPYAAEEITEAVSDLTVVVMRLAADVARGAGASQLGAESLDEALRLLQSYSAAASKLPRKSEPAASARAQGHDPLLDRVKPPYFADVSAGSGLPEAEVSVPEDPRSPTVNKKIYGASVADYDGDGRPDVFIATPYAGLYRNLGGMKFENATAKAGLSGVVECGARSAVFADYDGDGKLDLFVACRNGLSKLYRNVGGGRFEDVTEKSGIKAAQIRMGLWLDYDNDGKPDLFLSPAVHSAESVEPATKDQQIIPTMDDATNAPPSVLYHNNGDGTFTDVTAKAGVGDTRWSLATVAIDFDGDGRTDILVVNDFGKDVLWKNMGDGTFKDVSERAGVADYGHGMGVSVADYDGDGWPDLYVTNIGMYSPNTRYIRPNAKTARQTNVEMDTVLRLLEANHLYRNNKDGTFADVTEKDMDPVRTGFGWNGMFFDFDNDGHQDLFVENGFIPLTIFYNNERKILLHYDPAAKRFRDVSAGSGADLALNSRGGVYADFDGDGYPDLLLVGLHAPKLLKNMAARAGNHWLEVALKGKRSGTDGLGASVRVKAGELSQTAWVSGRGGNLSSQVWGPLHFGLGTAKTAGVEVKWPSGRTSQLTDVAADRTITVSEPDK